MIFHVHDSNSRLQLNAFIQQEISGTGEKTATYELSLNVPSGIHGSVSLSIQAGRVMAASQGFCFSVFTFCGL